MFCSNCGTQLHEECAFCPNCGAKIESRIPVTPPVEVTSPEVTNYSEHEVSNQPEIPADVSESNAENEPTVQPQETSPDSFENISSNSTPTEYTQPIPAVEPTYDNTYNSDPQYGAPVEQAQTQFVTQDDQGNSNNGYSPAYAPSYPAPPAPKKSGKGLKVALPIIAVVILLLGGIGYYMFFGRAFTVTFDLNGGTLVEGEAVQTVKIGKDAKEPVAENGRQKLTWDKAFTNIRQDTVIKATWEKVPMDTTELASYVQERTVTIDVDDITGSSSSGSGFFIDDKGTIVTNNHVLDGATSMSITVNGGSKYDVAEIIDFNPVYDLAIVRIDLTGNEYLEFSTTPAATGEQVYAVGSALGTLDGTFTAGTVSNAQRTVGKIDCVQMDAAISPGNSGGPLVNVYGEVVGINTFSYSAGENLNLAIQPTVLDNLKRDKNYSMNEYKEWYKTESSRSYSPYNKNRDKYYYSLVNTYQYVTGSKCLYSVDDDGSYDGYYDCCRCYIYNYSSKNYDQYVEYLKSVGFEFDTDELFEGGTSYYYYNEKDDIQVDLFITSDGENLKIFVTT